MLYMVLLGGGGGEGVTRGRGNPELKGKSTGGGRIERYNREPGKK